MRWRWHSLAPAPSSVRVTYLALWHSLPHTAAHTGHSAARHISTPHRSSGRTHMGLPGRTPPTPQTHDHTGLGRTTHRPSGSHATQSGSPRPCYTVRPSTATGFNSKRTLLHTPTQWRESLPPLQEAAAGRLHPKSLLNSWDPGLAAGRLTPHARLLLRISRWKLSLLPPPRVRY